MLVRVDPVTVVLVPVVSVNDGVGTDVIAKGTVAVLAVNVRCDVENLVGD